MEITLMFPDGTGYTYGIIPGTDRIYNIDGLVYLEHKKEEYSDTFYVGFGHPYMRETISCVRSILRDGTVESSRAISICVSYVEEEKQWPFAEFVVSHGRKNDTPLYKFGISED